MVTSHAIVLVPNSFFTWYLLGIHAQTNCWWLFSTTNLPMFTIFSDKKEDLSFFMITWTTWVEVALKDVKEFNWEEGVAMLLILFYRISVFWLFSYISSIQILVLFYVEMSTITITAIVSIANLSPFRDKF